MAHNSNSHDAPWLPNSQTEMFSVYAGNARSSCLVVGAVANCSTHAGLLHWSFDRRNCSVSVGRSMSWRQLNAEDGNQCPSRVGRRQPGMQVSDRIFSHKIHVALVPWNFACEYYSGCSYISWKLVKGLGAMGESKLDRFLSVPLTWLMICTSCDPLPL